MIWVVLPVHNRIACARSFVACLKQQTETDFTLLLVDDGSTDGTAEFVLEQLPGSVVLRGDGNLWWGGSLDKAFRYLKRHARPDDIALMINDDVTFNPYFLAIGAEAVKAGSNTLILAECYSQDGKELLDRGLLVGWKTPFKGGALFRQVEDGEEPQVFSTRGLFLKMSDWAHIGGFHAVLLPHYFSDYEFTIRAHKMGYQLRTLPELKVCLDQTTSGKRQLASGVMEFLYDTLINKRYPTNVVYKISFLFLCCDPKYLFRNIRRTLSLFRRQLFSRLV